MSVDPDSLRASVHEAYSNAAREPEGRHPFPVGRGFAESLGYPSEVLAGIPAPSLEAFTGVSNVSVFAEIREGAATADVGCGAGLDSLVTARRAGPRGRVYGIDFSAAMLERARLSASELGHKNILFLRGDAERLPLPDSSIDAALVNGIFNLNPYRQAIFQELARVVRPGGAVWAAELVLRGALPEEEKTGAENWFS